MKLHFFLNKIWIQWSQFCLAIAKFLSNRRGVYISLKCSTSREELQSHRQSAKRGVFICQDKGKVREAKYTQEQREREFFSSVTRIAQHAWNASLSFSILTWIKWNGHKKKSMKKVGYFSEKKKDEPLTLIDVWCAINLKMKPFFFTGEI